MTSDEQQKALEEISWYRFLKVLAILFLVCVFLIPTIQAGNAGRGAIFGAIDGLINVAIWGFIIYLAKKVLLYVKFGKQSVKNSPLSKSSAAPIPVERPSVMENSSLKEVQIAKKKNNDRTSQVFLLLVAIIAISIYAYNSHNTKVECIKDILYIPANEKPSVFGGTPIKEDSHYVYYSPPGYAKHKFQTMNEATAYCMASKKN